MCLIIKSGESPYIIKRDKTVVKEIIDSRDGEHWTPYYQAAPLFPYDKEITALDRSGDELGHLVVDWRCISEGFHSYRIRINTLYHDSAICIIPKGAEICYGINNQVVSTKIIVFSSFRKYLQYKWKKLLGKKF